MWPNHVFGGGPFIFDCYTLSGPLDFKAFEYFFSLPMEMYNLGVEKIECTVQLATRSIVFGTARKQRVLLFLTSGLMAFICLWLLVLPNSNNEIIHILSYYTYSNFKLIYKSSKNVFNFLLGWAPWMVQWTGPGWTFSTTTGTRPTTTTTTTSTTRYRTLRYSVSRFNQRKFKLKCSLVSILIAHLLRRDDYQ